MAIYILLKTHNVTGKKYLCRHVTEDENTCYTYLGSGTYWKKHLETHGNDISTEIVAKCNSYEEAKTIGIHYSEKWNIVESKEFANLVPENGQGGSEVASQRKSFNRFGYEREPIKMLGQDNPSKRPEVGKKISDKLSGRKITWGDKISQSCKGRIPHNKGKPSPTSKTDHMNVQIQCPHCGTTGGMGAMKRWHFNNCKNKL
jgi:hypothetical protein